LRYSLFQKLQWPSVLSLALLAGLLYRHYTRDLIEGCLAFLNSARVAKFGQLEFQADRKIMDLSKMTMKEMMLADLSPRDISPASDRCYTPLTLLQTRSLSFL
jgi:hypothetical protein